MRLAVGVPGAGRWDGRGGQSAHLRFAAVVPGKARPSPVILSRHIHILAQLDGAVPREAAAGAEGAGARVCRDKTNLVTLTGKETEGGKSESTARKQGLPRSGRSRPRAAGRGGEGGREVRQGRRVRSG